jgi:hypothetical protein
VQPARADLVISESTVIDCPGMKTMLQEVPEASRAPLLKMLSPMLTGTPWVTTTFLKDNHLRTDMGQTTILVNSESGNQVTMNNLTHTYSIGPYNPFQKAAGDMTVHIYPTSQKASMLGHTVVRYMITMTSSILPKSQIGGDMWAAPDMPTPPSMGYTGGFAGGFQSEMSKVKGMPLAFRLVYTNTEAGDRSVMSYATSINSSPIELSEFRIPDDFHKGNVQTATITPSAGYPLGDGLPLDSTSPVTDDMIGAGDDGSGAGGVSSGALQGLLGGLGGSGGQGGSGAGDAAGMVSPQMLQQLEAELKSLTDGDSGQ